MPKLVIMTLLLSTHVLGANKSGLLKELFYDRIEQVVNQVKAQVQTAPQLKPERKPVVINKLDKFASDYKGKVKTQMATQFSEKDLSSIQSIFNNDQFKKIEVKMRQLSQAKEFREFVATKRIEQLDQKKWKKYLNQDAIIGLGKTVRSQLANLKASMLEAQGQNLESKQLAELKKKFDKEYEHLAQMTIFYTFDNLTSKEYGVLKKAHENAAYKRYIGFFTDFSQSFMKIVSGIMKDEFAQAQKGLKKK